MQTKDTIAAKIAERFSLTKKLSREVVDYVFDTITNEISAENGKVSINNFGTFSNVHHAEKNGVNPQTKEKIVISARTVPCFKASSVLKVSVTAGCDSKGKKKRKK